MKDIATTWCKEHSDLINSLPRYYRHAVGRNDSSSLFYLISRDEYNIISVASSLSTISSATLKKAESTLLHFSLAQPFEPSLQSTLLLFLPETPLKMECSDWLSFQSLIQELYSARVPLKSFHTELLAQKLTRVILGYLCDVDLCAGWSTYTAVLQCLSRQSSERHLLEMEPSHHSCIH